MKTITIYSGSANSKFQFNLPSGEERKIRFIIPPSESEFKKIIKDENSTLKFDRQESEIIKLENATGRNFREMSHYIQVFKSDYEVYMQRTKRNMTIRLETFTYQSTEKEVKMFLKNLDILFGLQFYNKKPSFSGPFYDRGLIYEDEYSNISFLNYPAKEVLLSYYIDHLEMEKIDDMNGNDIKGKYLEKYCIKSDLLSSISMQLFRSDKSIKSMIKYEATDFDYLEYLNIGEGKKYFKTTLFLTKNSLFLYIDYVIYIPESQKIIFKQITMSTISSHLKSSLTEYKKFEDKYSNLETVGEVIKFLCYPIYSWDEGLKMKEKGKSVCHIILELFFGIIEKYNVEIKDDIFKVFDDQKLLDIEIIYVTGTKSEENNQSFPLKNLLFCFREDLVKLKIPF